MDSIIDKFLKRPRNKKGAPSDRAIKEAENIYQRITSFANYSEMNGIEKDWIVKKIAEGLDRF